VELPVHQAIYRKRKARAVVHAHPPFAVTLSLLPGDFLPLDTEGALVLGPRIPVVEAGSGSGELAEAVSAALAESLVVLVRGHGCFARSPETLTEAMSIVTTLEASAETKYRSLLLKKL
jgi:L-fuculose-phosphate aldolase